MLAPEEKREIEELLGEYGGDARAAGVEALKVVQRHRGWISDEAMAELGDFLGLAEADLEGVATFYNLIFRRPVGRHVVLLCDSISCWIVGYEEMRERLSERLGVGFGQTTADGRFTLLPTVCLGACDRAPAMMVDRDLHANLEPERIDEILSAYD